MELSKERSCALPYTLGCSYWKRILWVALNYGQPTYIYKNIYIYIYIYILEWVKRIAIFLYALVCGIYIMWLKEFNLKEVPAVVGSILIVGDLTHCGNSSLQMKTILMNVLSRLIWELMISEIKHGHKNVETAKIIWYIWLEYSNQMVQNFTTVTRISMTRQA